MLSDSKMDAAYFGTFPAKPQGGTKAQKMLPKPAGVTHCDEEKKGRQRSMISMD